MSSHSHFPFQQIQSPQLLKPPCQKRIGNKYKEKTPSAASTRRNSSDSLDLNVKFKTEICKYYCMQVECPFGYMCCFAHGEEELRAKETIPIKYKTKPCTKFSLEGYCPYGTRCQFIHSSSRQIIKFQRMLDQLQNDSELFFELLNLESNAVPKRPSFFQKLQENEWEGSFQGENSGQKYAVQERYAYSFQQGGMGYRTRYNSI